ncbi:MAG: transposase [Mojavia pulchra JT2-VF2]|uniref:Transposase n=1 Tax=Mojavia pulchra JT2-VF2 TaxID=287848 RepID=A0A951PX79_9NOST|nr:transposase [Mojavia pulchra JT2-VF2]
MRKLTDSDKQEILKLYRETAETTSTLAERYGVSNSTISRLLKSTLPEEEYEYLVSLKRAARTPEGRAQVSYEQLPLLSQPEQETLSNQTESSQLPEIESAEVDLEAESQKEDGTNFTPVIRRVRRRSSAETKAQPAAEQLEILPKKPPESASIPSLKLPEVTSIPSPKRPEITSIPSPKLPEVTSIPSPKRPEITSIPSPKRPEITNISSPMLEDEHPQANVFAQMLGEDLLDESEDLDDLDDDLEEEDFEDEDDDFEEPRPLVARRRPGEAPVQVLPLSSALLPKTCYLVIDRSSELITRPLKDFGDLGQIPTIETQQRTLPIFDNHRVAKRFSTKRDRVIKVPDSKMLHKARTHLQAKGITRLLIDGQVYSLSPV